MRRQGELVNGVEPRVLDYTSQQAKVGYFFIFARISKDMLETTSPIPQVLPPLALAVGLHLPPCPRVVASWCVCVWGGLW